MTRITARKECPRCRYSKAITSFRGGDLCLACQRSQEQASKAGAVKRCLRCGEPKPGSDYWRDRTKRDGLRPECKACRWMRSRDYLGRRGWSPDIHRTEGKICFCCRQDKPRSAFSRLRTCADGLSPVCRLCKSFQRAKRTEKLFDSSGRIRIPPQRTRWLDELIPSLAADLARRLAEPPQEDSLPARETGATPRRPCAKRELISTDQWRQCIGLIGRGLPVGSAIRRAGIRPRILRQYLRAVPTLRARWEYAKACARRRNWSHLLIDEVLEDVATTGMSLKQAVTSRGANYNAFVKLTQRDPALEERYLWAKEIQAFALGGEIVAEADNAWSTSAQRQVRKKMWQLEALAPRRLRKRAKSGVDVAGSERAARIEDARRRARLPR